MKVLYISYDGMTDPLGQSQVLPYLQGIGRQGYEIFLLSCEKAEKFEKNKETIQSICTASGIHWIPLKYTRKPPVLSTVYDVMKLRNKARKLCIQNDIRIVHCRSYISSLIGLYLKRKLGTKFIFDMRGFWADERVEGNLWSLKNPIYKSVYKFFKRKELEFLKEADYTVSLTQNAADEIHSWKQVPTQPIPIKVIPCCADLSLFNSAQVSEVQTNALRHQLSIGKEQFVLSYIGSLGTWYMLPEMLDFFKALLKTKPTAVFLFVTNDPGEYIFSLAEKKDIPREKIIVTRAERKAMPAHISISSFNIFFIKPTFAKKASSPVKQGEVMGMGIPIICNSGIGDTDMIVKDSSAGIIINNFSDSEYSIAIEKINSLELKRENIVAGATKYYSLDKGIERYLEVYRNIAL